MLAVLLGATALAGCGRDDHSTLTVLAAASLTETYEQLADEFEATHDGVEVRLVFDSSATLADKAIDHAPGDVLATADKKTMDHAVAGDGVAGDPEEFATNVVVIALPADNPAGIDDVSDLQSDDVDYLTCVETAPCGAAAKALLGAAGITHPPVSEEVDVKAVLTKIVAGEADAGLVYRTDATTEADAVSSVDVPGADADPNTYWTAVTAGAEEPDLAREWIDLVLGDTGRQILTDAGFGSPTP